MPGKSRKYVVDAFRNPIYFIFCFSLSVCRTLSGRNHFCSFPSPSPSLPVAEIISVATIGSQYSFSATVSRSNFYLLYLSSFGFEDCSTGGISCLSNCDFLPFLSSSPLHFLFLVCSVGNLALSLAFTLNMPKHHAYGHYPSITDL